MRVPCAYVPCTHVGAGTRLHAHQGSATTSQRTSRWHIELMDFSKTASKLTLRPPTASTTSHIQCTASCWQSERLLVPASRDVHRRCWQSRRCEPELFSERAHMRAASGDDGGAADAVGHRRLSASALRLAMQRGVEALERETPEPRGDHGDRDDPKPAGLEPASVSSSLSAMSATQAWSSLVKPRCRSPPTRRTPSRPMGAISRHAVCGGSSSENSSRPAGARHAGS